MHVGMNGDYNMSEKKYEGLIKTEEDLDLFMIVLVQFLFGDDGGD